MNAGKTRSVIAVAAVLLYAPVSWGAVTSYQQDFELVNAADPAALGPFGENFTIFADVWGKAGSSDATVGVDIFLYSYGPFAAPNGGPGFSAVGTGEGGVNQGLQYLNIYSDYNNADQTTGGSCGAAQSCTINTSVFREYAAIDGSNIGQIWTLEFDAKSPFQNGIFDAANPNGGDINNPTSASAFIKTLNPLAGYATTNDIRVDMTNISNVDWVRYSISLDLSDPLLAGQILQFGFNTVTTGYDNTGVYYDNICFNNTGGGCFPVIPVPPAVWLFGSAIGLLTVVRRKFAS